MSEPALEEHQALTLPAEYVHGVELREAREAAQEIHGGHKPLSVAKQYAVTLSLKGLLITEGEEMTPGAAARANTYAQYEAEDVQDAREFLAENAPRSKVNNLDDTQLKEWLINRYESFITEAETREHELEEAKQKFTERVEQAIEEQHLPISRQQLHDRLDQVKLSFEDPLNGPGRSGVFFGEAGIACVSLDVTGEDLEQVVFHELLHSISGGRYIAPGEEELAADLSVWNRRTGLGHPIKRSSEGNGNDRIWLNEAVTDLLTNILCDNTKRGKEFDFSSTKPLAQGGNARAIMDSLPDSLADIYANYKFAALSATKQIPTITLLRAYFSQDRDEYETDPLAGAHAERDLQRAIKVAGGAERIGEFRLINQAFTEDDNQAAMEVLRHIIRTDYSSRGEQERVLNRRKVAEHTRTYQNRIERAKAHLKTREPHP